MANRQPDEPLTVKPLRGYRSPIDAERINRRIDESLRRKIAELIDKYPDMALRVLRSWSDANHR